MFYNPKSKFQRLEKVIIIFTFKMHKFSKMENCNETGGHRKGGNESMGSTETTNSISTSYEVEKNVEHLNKTTTGTRMEYSDTI